MMLERSRVATLVGALVAFSLQFVVAPNIAILGAMPNFVVAYAIVLAVARPATSPTPLAFGLGLLYNLAAGGPVGAMAFLLVLVTYAASRALSVLANGALFMPIATLFVSSIVVELLYAVLTVSLGFEAELFSALIGRALPCALYDCVAGLALYPLVLKFVVGSGAPREPIEATNLR